MFLKALKVILQKYRLHISTEAPTVLVLDDDSVIGRADWGTQSTSIGLGIGYDAGV